MATSSFVSLLLKIETWSLMAGHGLLTMLHSSLSLGLLRSSHRRIASHELWMRLPDLPSVCWNQPVLQLIVAAASVSFAWTIPHPCLLKAALLASWSRFRRLNHLFQELMLNLRALNYLPFGTNLSPNMFICFLLFVAVVVVYNLTASFFFFSSFERRT